MFKGILLFLLFSFGAGPVIAGITPYNGWYWNPDQPGVGFNIEIQRGEFKPDGWVFMAGYLYDEDRQPLWVTMQGMYIPASWEEMRDAGGSYIGKLDSSVYISRNGQCVGCDYQSPDTAPDTNLGPAVVRFTSLTSAVVEFRGDSWPVQLMDWHDQSNLVGDYDAALGGTWDLLGMTYQDDGYMAEKIGLLMEANGRNFHTFNDSYAGYFPPVTLPDGALFVGFRACNLIDASVWNNETHPEIAAGERDCFYDTYFGDLMYFIGHDGNWWFVTKYDIENTDHAATYGGVAGRLFISRNEMIGVGLVDGATYFQEHFGAVPTGSESNKVTSDAKLKKVYLRFTRRVNRYEIDDFLETGSAFREEWSLYK